MPQNIPCVKKRYNMMQKLIILLVALLFPLQLFGSANIDTDVVEFVVHVNNQHPKASDLNKGTPQAPLLTLQNAIERCKYLPSKIIVHPGHYRSYLDITSNKLLIIEAQSPKTVFISGSDVFKNWVKQGQVYYHDWFYNWGPYEDSDKCFGPCKLTEYQKRREMVFVDSIPVKQVVSLSELEENCFFVDEQNDKIYLNPGQGVNLEEARIEVSTRGYDIYDLGRNGTLVRATVHNDQGLMLKGLVFQHTANTMHQDALTISNTGNVLIDDCVFQWNNGVGLELENCSNVTVRNTVVRYNGERGMGTGMGENLHFENLTIYENNWRTNAAKIISHDAAGIKIFGGNKNVILENINAYNNNCHAIWFDWDNENFIIRNSTITDNQEAGILLEGSRKSALIQNCTLKNNDIGIKGYGHANVTIERSLLYGNNHQIRLGQDGRQVNQDSNWEINSKDWKLFNNQIIATESDQSLFTFFEYHNPDKPSTWASIDFLKTVQADYNTYFHPSEGKQFPDGKHLEGGQLTFENWKKISGQDKHSYWESLNLRLILNN